MVFFSCPHTCTYVMHSFHITKSRKLFSSSKYSRQHAMCILLNLYIMKPRDQHVLVVRSNNVLARMQYKVLID